MNRDPIFYNKRGELTKYALFCGYVEKKETPEKHKELFIEHGHIHVRSGNKGQQVNVWETFSAGELTKARKLFRSIKI